MPSLGLLFSATLLLARGAEPDKQQRPPGHHQHDHEQHRRRRRLNPTDEARRVKRAAAVEALLARVEPEPEKVMPHVGPVRGVGYFDFERVTHFADREAGTGTKHGTCTMRSCEGVDLVAAIQVGRMQR